MLKHLRLLLALATTLGLPGCSGIDFGDNPSKAPPRSDTSLAAPPPELRNGAAH